MKFLNVLCKDINEFENNNDVVNFSEEENCLVRIYVSSPDKEFALNFAKKIRDKLPKANIIGTSVDGVLYKGDIYEDYHLVSIISFKKANIYTKLMPDSIIKDGDMGVAIANEVNKHEPSSVFLYLGRENNAVYHITQYLNKECKDASFSGGVSGYLNKKTNELTHYVFDDTAVIDDGFVLAGIGKEYVLSYTNAVVGHEPVSDIHTITKTDGIYLEEIDNQNANDWIKEKIGLTSLYKNEEKNLNNDILIRIPFVLEGEDGASRILAYIEDIDKFSPNFTYLNENQEFRVGYLSALKSIEEWQNICLELQNISVEYMFTHSCLYRRIYLENLSKQELQPFKDAKVTGAFFRGEIGTKNETTRYYNGTCSLITLAEEENYIDIDLSAFHSLANLNDNVELLENLDKIAGDSKPTVNALKNSQNNEYSKICIITNEIFDDNLNEVIGSKQREISANILMKTREFLQNEYKNVKVQYYRYNKHTFFFVINEVKNDAKIIEITQNLYNYINNYVLKLDKYKVYNKITISLKPERIQKLVLSQSNIKDSVNKNVFNIFSEKDEVLTLQEEFEVVATLKTIVENESVMPYVQGIYDNLNGGFYAYEVIMRLMSASGEVLFPEHFLNTAKKYDVYLDLNRILVKKVLDFANGRNEKILINISVKDIESDEFAKLVFSTLAKMKNPENIIFEVYDLSECSEWHKLKLFVFKLDQLKMKFAIDNFEIENYELLREHEIKVDYLKITSSYLNDASSRNLSENIFTISKKMQAELMVKHVETAAMQKQVLANSIQYTQGFFFSRPVSIDETHAMSESKPRKEDLIKNSKKTDISKESDKKSKIFVYYGIVIFIALSIIATVMFTNKNSNLVTEMNDTFLEELASGLTNQISMQVQDAEKSLQLSKSLIEVDGYEKEDIFNNLILACSQSKFDEMYISFNGDIPINERNQELGIDVSDLYGKVGVNTVLTTSPMMDKTTNREIFIMATPIFDGDTRVAEIYGVFYIDSFADILNLQVFGGEAFFHICEIDGTAIVISGDNNNLFQGGDMYTFIESLDMTNDNTTQSIKLDMENSVPVLLKYKINNQERTAVMLRIPGTQWCVISIVLDETIDVIKSDINSNAFNFSIFVLVIFIIYSLIIIELERKNKKELLKALETSNLLANSLQTNMEMDSLTRTFSRSTVEEKITKIITSPNADDNCAFVLLDVDNFKSINDTYGHKTGDVFLQELTSAVKSSLRGGDIIGRIGGDEFVILLNDIMDINVTKTILSRILANVNKIEIKGVSLQQVSISAGVALVPKEGIDYDEISMKADKALYLAKLAGKNKFMIYDEL